MNRWMGVKAGLKDCLVKLKNKEYHMLEILNNYK
jgi:hypothetical protein